MTSSTAPTDEEMRKLLKPNPSEEQVLDALYKSYVKPGSKVTIIKELDSYDDVNYLAEIDGVRYLVKIHNGVESEDFLKIRGSNTYYRDCGTESIIHLQNALMKHLISHGISTSEPQQTCVMSETEPVPAPASVQSLPVVSSQHSPRQLVIRLLSWLPGRTMSSLQVLPIECLAQAGRFLGRMDEKLDLLDCNDFAAAKRYHAWDGKNTADVRKFIHCITDDKRRSLVASVLDAFQTEIIDSGAGDGFRQGMLQGDFNDANILMDDNLKVSGVIDFGDSVMSWRVWDVAVAMSYAMISTYGKHDRAISAACAMLRGFHSVYPLKDDERQHLQLLMSCRLACSATLGAYSYQQNPENDYLLLHAEPAWKALELIWGYDADYRSSMKQSFFQMFDLACGKDGTDTNGVIYCSDIALPDPCIVDILCPLRSDATQSAKRQKLDLNETVNGKPVITFVTGNKKKLEEVKRILGTNDASDGSSLPFVITNHKVDLPELQGDPLDIAKEKCAEAAKQVGGAVITEDTSLCFTALEGLPGPYIKWFLDKCGHDGLNNMIAFSQDKTAYAQTVVAFSPGTGKDVIVFDGRTMGKIVPPRGSLDFGWDPVFEPDEGKGLTYAEMSKKGKDSISHRSRAFSQLRDYFLREQATITSEMS